MDSGWACLPGVSVAPMSFLSVWSCLVGSSGPFLALLMHYGPCWSIDSLFFRLRSGLGVECIIFLLSFFVVHFPDITFSLFDPPVHGRPLLIFLFCTCRFHIPVPMFWIKLNQGSWRIWRPWTASGRPFHSVFAQPRPGF